MFLIFASIGLPSKISFIDCLNHYIHFVWRFMFKMHINSLLWSCFLDCTMFGRFLFLTFLTFIQQIDWSDLMMSNNSICLHFFCVYFFCFFVLIILNSFSKKACCSMLAHCLLNSSNIRDVLNKTNHGTIALRSELFIISCFNSCKFQYSIFVCFCNWILSNIIFYLISKIRKEPLSII